MCRFKLSLPVMGLVLSLLAFCVTRFYKLEEFPIYFFCDEAFIGVETQKLIANRFYSPDSTFLPMYWNKAEGRWVPQISIYLSIIPSILFPRTIWPLRAVTGIISLIGILIASWGFQKSEKNSALWWLPLGLATIMPVLILHNRLAFETSNAISGIFATIGFYLAYRLDNPKYLTGFILAALFTFYSHWSGSIVISAISFMLLVIDSPYHLSVARKHPTFFIGHTILILLGAVPFVRFLLFQPLGIYQQLSLLGSDVTKDEPASNILWSGFLRYTSAFNPYYWFTYNFNPNEIRHLWKDRPLLGTFTIVPLLIGLIVNVSTFWKVRSRVLLVALLAGAMPLLMVETHVQRMFYIIAPVILIMTTGITYCYKFCRLPLIKISLQSLFLITLLIDSVLLTKEFVGAKLWYHAYTLGGLQWGAKALFAEAIPKILDLHPEIVITPSGEWANGADTFPKFFLRADHLKRIVSSPFDILHPESDQRLSANHIFILSTPELERISQSGKFKKVLPLLEIPYPDGTLGFTFTRLEYLDNIEELMAPERLARLVPQHASLAIWGTNAQISYSRLDIGTIDEAFDANHFTIARGLTANPFVIDISFEQPRLGNRIFLDLYPMSAAVNVIAKNSDGKNIGEGHSKVMNDDPAKDTFMEISFAEVPISFNSISIQIQSLRDLPNRAHVHIRELRLEESPKFGFNPSP